MSNTNLFDSPKYKVGAIVLYRGSFGQGAIEQVIVLDNDDDKNDRRVYGLNNGHWCYEDQIIGELDSIFERGN